MQVGNTVPRKKVEILYKIEAVIRQFRALRVCSIPITTGSHLPNKEGNIQPELKTRADIYNCKILITKDIRQLAADADSAEKVKAILFAR